MSSARHMVERLRRLMKWRQIVQVVAEAAKQVLGEDIKVYVIGGAAEDRLTALSDIDVLIVLPRDPDPYEATRISRLVYEKAVDLGMPWDYPLDLHIAGPHLLELYKRFSRRMIEVK
ncbi:nucleotidyltransferase domain-containing protein [Pyrofollis japonicus]|uniref:nucleotidyltransferase domain-containing protein n=1 Tax=Pyrofollis japonicus TaxID=3060460 RepID=UPI00295BCC68|nr:nucleotidyltransferase domain-containing protein [Pyrofollis japonicus]